MPRIKLTERTLPTLKGRPEDSKSREPMLYFDKDLPGFGVAVSTKTGIKTFIVQRDLPNGKTRRIKLGRVSDTYTLKRAREEAEERIRDMDRGIDPKAARKGALTLSEWLDLYLTRDRLSERSKSDYKKNTERHLKDWLDDKLADIKGQQVQDRHAEIGDDAGKAMADSVMRGFRAVYNYALIRDPSLPANPTLWLKGHWSKPKPRTRRVKADQLPAFYGAVLALPNPVQGDYLRFVLFTGIRREQAAALTWEYVDFTARVIRFPGDETKGKSDFNLPMTDFVHDLLKARYDAPRNPKWVFPANSESGHIEEPKYPFELIKQKIGLHWSVHDLRRTYADALDATEMNAYALKALMHHARQGNGDVTRGYLAMQTERLRKPAQDACDLLKQWCGIK